MNTNLTDFDIFCMLRNPVKIDDIRDELLSLTGNSMFLIAVKEGAKDDINECLLMILSQARDNRRLVSEIIGKKLLEKIENL